MPFPDGFLWGASTAAHQVEGNNVTSDWWAREHGRLEGAMPVPQPSGDAADSFFRYPEDMRLLADAGLTAYRFSIEWARIEPEPGFISRGMIDHYRRMVDTARDLGLEPVVTAHHFTNPAWFTRDVGWSDPLSVDYFGRYAQTVLPILRDVDLVCTINEPNILATLMAESNREWIGEGLPPADEAMTEHLLSAHQLSGAIFRGEGKRVGWSVATQSIEAEPGAEDVAAEWGRTREDVFLDAARHDDWVGVQAYTRTRIGADGPLAVADDAERTLTEWEYYPGALEAGVRRAWERGEGTPIYVTENGIATTDDARRIDYTSAALAGLEHAISDGIDVRGYLHWSALDNYEWGSYLPTFGLIGWEPGTFERNPKPSLGWLGSVARENRLPL
jgi:beta-glucosidase